MELLSPNFMCSRFIPQYLGEICRCFGYKAAMEGPSAADCWSWERWVPTFGTKPCFSPEECQGSTERLVVSRLPHGSPAARKSRLNQPSWCYLLHVFPSQQGAAWTFPFCSATSHTQTPTKPSAHCRFQSTDVPFCREEKPRPWLWHQFSLWFASFCVICHNTPDFQQARE